MIGQERLLQLLDNYTIKTFPRSSLFVGPKGCGKHTVVKYISSKLKIDVVDITEIFSKDVIDQLYQEVNCKIYLLDLTSLDVRKQNIFLKFLEEPLQNAFVVLLTETLVNILPTVQNRCQVFAFDSYTKATLLQFTSNTELVEFADTPGKIDQYRDFDTKYYIALSDKIIESISKATWPNLFSLVEKLNFEDGTFDLFIPILLYRFRVAIVSGARIYKQYQLTSNMMNEARIAKLNKQRLFEKYLFELKEMMTQ